MEHGLDLEKNIPKRVRSRGSLPLKTVIIQTVLPRYLTPLFERLSVLNGIELTVLADLKTERQLNQYRRGQDHFNAVHVGTASVGRVVVRPGLFKTLLAIRPDIVIINPDPREVSQLLTLLWCRARNIPVGAWSMFHRVGEKRLVFELYMTIVGWLGDIQLSYANRGRREQIARGISADKIVVLGTAIDQHKVIAVRDRISDAALVEFREAQGLAGKKVLLHVVRLTTIKRADLTLRCLARIVERRRDVLLVFIGGGPLETEMKALSAELELDAFVRFLGPIYDENTLALWFKNADVFVMATCIGLSIHHAMCYGLPVVTDDSQFTQASEFEAMVNNETGLTYRAGDLDDYALNVSRILDDAELRQRLSVGALKRIGTEFSIDRKVENFEIAIRRLAGTQLS
jgi:glycosyltransferase involved in cell wall biosynthesis